MRVAAFLGREGSHFAPHFAFFVLFFVIFFKSEPRVFYWGVIKILHMI